MVTASPRVVFKGLSPKRWPSCVTNRAKARRYWGEQLPLPKPQSVVSPKYPVLTQKLCGSSPALHSSHWVVSGEYWCWRVEAGGNRLLKPQSPCQLSSSHSLISSPVYLQQRSEWVKRSQEEQSTRGVVVSVHGMRKSKLQEEEWDPEAGILQRDTSSPDKIQNHGEEMPKKNHEHMLLILFLLFKVERVI